MTYTIYQAALNDLVQGLFKWRIWVTLAWHALYQRYRMSWIGLGWISISFALLIAVKIFIFGALSDKDVSYFAPYLATGYLSFRLISNFVVQGTGVFISAQSWIKSEPLPLTIHIYKLITNLFIQFAFMAIPAFLVCLYFERFHMIVVLWLPVVLFIFALNGVWMSAIFGILAARYRDARFLTGSVMMVVYFMTPVLWVPPETGPRAILAKYNPLTHYIEILRQPVMEGILPLQSLIIVLIITVSGMITAFFMFAKKRNSIIYWI